MIEKLPRTLAEVKTKAERDRKYNLQMGADARYDVFGGNEKSENCWMTRRTLAPLVLAVCLTV